MILLIFLEFTPYTKNIFLLIPLAGLSTFHFPCGKFRLSHSCLCPCSRKTPFHARAILCRMECSSFFAIWAENDTLNLCYPPGIPRVKFHPDFPAAHKGTAPWGATCHCCSVGDTGQILPQKEPPGAHGCTQGARYLLRCVVFPGQQRLAKLNARSEAVVSGINFCFDPLVIVHEEFHRWNIPKMTRNTDFGFHSCYICKLTHNSMRKKLVPQKQNSTILARIRDQITPVWDRISLGTIFQGNYSSSHPQAAAAAGSESHSQWHWALQMLPSSPAALSLNGEEMPHITLAFPGLLSAG